MRLVLRPTRHLASTLPADELLARFEAMLNSHDCPCEGNVLGSHVTLKIRDAERRFWSPWLNIEIEPRPDNTSILHARFSPHPNIWTMVALSYIAMAVVIMIGGCFALSQWWIKQPPTALWSFPFALLVSAALFIASQIGQKLASDEMDMLDRLMHETAGLDAGMILASSAPSAHEG
ncbi:MAG: hypothetical protein DYG94_04720 [Leptolyngbya sp. PLA3]|nr:MAG: hypothetical protein EDM82_03870 [Cyanobacteria bacterium CYA]MCE7968035.1 hypothetical protein [Leptolyngbya sp. PL-A3]